jgi:GDP/UDP-N,N'-diacetylbacillosamine 2-epimerase (hydrolysing)
MRRVAIVTGTRAEYGLFVPILREMEHGGKLKPALYVTGMHLSEEFGRTVEQVEADGFRIAGRIDVLSVDDTGAGMARYLGELTSALAREWERKRPDVVLVLGDRGEMLAAAITANCMNIPVVHLHGGEVSGSVDDGFRHAITKLAHLHLPATRKSAARIERMGEDAWRIKVVGAPGLDGILMAGEPEAKVARRLGIRKGKPLILVVQHPVVQEAVEAGRQMGETLAAVAELGEQAVVIYPNADPGGREMIKVIKRYAKRHPAIKAFKSLGRREYLGVMLMSSVIVGNSSSGLIEAPSFGLPAINVGRRQRGRERGANVTDAPHSREAILRALRRFIGDPVIKARLRKHSNPYGDGKTAPRVVRAIGALKIDERLLHKSLRY